MSPNGSFGESCRQSVTRTADSLALDASGNITVKGRAGGQPPFGVFTRFINIKATGAKNWNRDASRITFTGDQVKTLGSAGMRLAGGMVKVDTPGQLWAVHAKINIRTTGGARIWAIIEGLHQTRFAETVPMGTIDVHRVTDAAPWNPPFVLNIHGTGPTPEMEASGEGFGSVLLRSDNPTAVTASFIHLTITHIGPRSTAPSGSSGR